MEQSRIIDPDGIRPHLWTSVAHSHQEYLGIVADNEDMLTQRRSLEEQLAELLAPQASASLAGFCHACARYRPFVYDHLHAPEHQVNWRERLVCPTCKLNNRLRLSMHLLEDRVGLQQTVYLTEALTPFADALRQRRDKVVMSEYLGDGLRPGQLNPNGVRHEDVTRLSFQSTCFDHVLSFDVLEHVPAYEHALAEFHRVLRPGGTLLLSIPFVLSSTVTIHRARLTPQGKVQHLLPPEYHGDPVGNGKGILCYYHFGWDLLDTLRNLGFQEVAVELFWSLGYGYIGPEQVVIRAIKH